MFRMKCSLLKEKFVHISPDARYRYGLSRDERQKQGKLVRLHFFLIYFLKGRVGFYFIFVFVRIEIGPFKRKRSTPMLT